MYSDVEHNITCVHLQLVCTNVYGNGASFADGHPWHSLSDPELPVADFVNDKSGDTPKRTSGPGLLSESGPAYELDVKWKDLYGMPVPTGKRLTSNRVIVRVIRRLIWHPVGWDMHYVSVPVFVWVYSDRPYWVAKAGTQSC